MERASPAPRASPAARAEEARAPGFDLSHPRGVQATDDTELRGRRLVRLGEVESRFEAIPIDAVVAREYCRLAAALLRRGRRPRSRVMDLLIAATAAALQLPVLTRDADLLALSDLLDVRRPS